MMNYDMDMLTRIQGAYVPLAVRNTSMDSAQLWGRDFSSWRRKMRRRWLKLWKRREVVRRKRKEGRSP